MSNILLTKDEQGTVVFKFFPSLSYGNRILLSFIIIAVGIALQILFIEQFYIGCAFVFAGNMLLLVSGYDNRIKFGSFNPKSKWERVDKDKMSELIAMQKKMLNWDMSSTDCSNLLGGVFMLMIILVSAIMISIGVAGNDRYILVLGVNTAVLLLPHWVTGLRRISLLLKPALKRKMYVIKEVLHGARRRLKAHEVEFYMLLSGKDAKIPNDAKFKIEIKDHHPDFLGLYGQVVMNNVQGTLYPYFYTVLVAKKGYGLNKNNVKNIKTGRKKKSWLSLLTGKTPGITKTFKNQKDVEVYVVRQSTTSTSGYHTNRDAAINILLTGLEIAESVAKKTQ